MLNFSILNIENCLLKEKNIGLFLSGGFDSTTLAYTIFDIISRLELSTNVTVYTVPRYDDSVVHVDRVCEWLKTEFPSIEFNRKTNGNPDLIHYQQVSSGISDALKNSDDFIILGDTSNPDDSDLNNGPIRTKSTNPRIYQPFMDYDKRTTISLAKNLGILDKISAVSHTCTESKTLRCNMCWQCRERAWSFEKLNLNDVGTM